MAAEDQGNPNDVNSAIESVVAAYVQTQQLDILLDLKAHRERLAAAVRDRADFDYGVLLHQLEDDIAALDAGIRRLRAAAEPRPEGGS